ncbi:hypothetical protein KO02_17590 [Sphingobacterium sp. ML3W]|uniref:hypothetical protein n=1 Tax=Sphingobacterium sp. ML3W TaxID=1538644 RepID=UPI0004F73562|nr:hypothetical protein [Sphingobacterium sp. ML3W]AIM38296.1 hypothetical protein KO02_17590 [Sphingobacterium sp. ML3W]
MKQQAWLVKVRVKHANTSYKMSPPFVTVLALAKTKAEAEYRVIQGINDAGTDPDITYEKFRVTKVRCDIIVSC